MFLPRVFDVFFFHCFQKLNYWIQILLFDVAWHNGEMLWIFIIISGPNTSVYLFTQKQFNTQEKYGQYKDIHVHLVR